MKNKNPGFFFMTARKKVVFALVIAGQVLSSLFDLVSLSLVAPFVFFASDPTLVDRNQVLKSIYRMIGVHNASDFLQVVGIGILVFLVLSGIFKVVASQGSLRFARAVTIELSQRQLATILGLQLRHFERVGASQLRFLILTDLQQAVNGVLIPTIDLISKGLVSFIFLIGMLSINPVVVLFLILGFVSFYGVVFLMQKGRLHGYGTKVRQTSKSISRQVSDLVDSVREIKVYGGEQAQTEEMRDQQKHLAAMQYRSSFMGTIPRISLETVILSSVVLYLLTNISSGELKDILPILGVIVVVFFRLSGIFQGIFMAFSKIRMNLASYKEFRNRVIDLSNPDLQETVESDSPIPPLTQTLELRKVSFAYDSQIPVLKDVSLTIRKGSWVGFAGSSGSGKSTLLDIVSGLLRPDSGEVLIDGVVSPNGSGLWHGGQMAFASQTCVLVEKTISENIAFGVPPSEIDHDRVVWAAKMAVIEDYIRGCPKGYDTVLAEDGLKPSGGQRQRLALARALYRQAPILLLDEVTSALDPETEEAVASNLRALPNKPTVILISHKPALLQFCERIYVLEAGSVKDSGTWEEVSLRNDRLEGEL